VNEDGLLFWIVAAAVVGLLLIAVGLLGAMVRAHDAEGGD
jgi:hypothetical protein